MITLSIVLFVIALVAALKTLVGLSGGEGLFARMGNLFNGKFFAENVFSANKIAFYLFVILVIAAVVLLILGLKKAKDEDASKKSFDTKAKKYLRGLRGEFGKVIWPTPASVARNTLATLGFCLVLGAIIVVIDLGLAQLIKLLLSIGG